MRKTELSNAEILKLDSELNGVVNRVTGVKESEGLLDSGIPIKLRYWLTRLSQKVEKRKEIIEKLNQDLIKKYGKEEDGKITIPNTIKKGKEEIVNPDIEAYYKDYIDMLSEKEELEHPNFKLEDFGDLNTAVDLRVLLSLVEE